MNWPSFFCDIFTCSDGHASMLLLGEGSEATEPYNKYANLFYSFPVKFSCKNANNSFRNNRTVSLFSE